MITGMVYPLMRMDRTRRRKYTTVTCFLHAISALFTLISFLLILPELTPEIVQFVSYHKLINHLLGFVPFTIVLLQLFTFIVHVCSIVAFVEQRQVYSRWSPRYLKLLMSVLIVSFICSSFISLIIIIYYQKFDTFLKSGITEHIVGFSTKQANRLEMNWLQGFFECCGVFGFGDWLPLTAGNSLSESHLMSDKNQRSHCVMNGCYLPYSCCITNQLKCSPFILLQNFSKNEEIAKHRVKEWFYFTGPGFSGCLEEVKRKLLIVLPLTFSILNVLTQCITLLYSQIVYTSYYMVGRCNTQDAILPAWILPFPPPYPEALIKRCQELLEQGRDFRELIIRNELSL